MPVGYKTDTLGEAGDADPLMDHKSTSPDICPGATMGKGPGVFSKRTLDPPSVLALLDFFEKLFGLLFVLGIVGKLYRESPNGGEKTARRRPILHRYVAPRQLQPAGDDRRIEVTALFKYSMDFSMLPVGMDRP